MLFASDVVFEARQQIMLDLEHHKIDTEEALRKALALDPNDFLALVIRADARQIAGDTAGAEEILWSAIQAQPCAWVTYMKLSVLLKDQEALSKGLVELACRKVLLDPAALEELEDNASPFSGFEQGRKELEGLSGEAKLEMLADALRQERDREPVSVTARLHSLRLIHDLQEAEDLSSDQVDALVQEGESIVPLLIGVLRGWARGILPEDDTWSVENSLAVLGEIGDSSAIPEILELVTMEDVNVSGPAAWALDRNVEQHPDDAGRVFARIADLLDAQQRIAFASTLARFPQLAHTPDLLEKLFDNLDRMEARDRDDCFQVLSSAAIMVLGRPGIEFARTMLRRHGGILSKKIRRDSEEIIHEFGSINIPPSPPAEPSQWTVYDICAGVADWEAEAEKLREENDESLPPEPVRRNAVPGRNDPCWCGSGKKYKKCHLDADEAADHEAREPRRETTEAPEGELDDLRTRIGEFMHRALTVKESSLAMKEFTGSEKLDAVTDPMTFIDWMVHDRIFPSFGRTVMEEYLKRNASSLTDAERTFLESSARSYIDLLEVREVMEGSGLEVKSLTSGETSFVHDISLSEVTVRWDGLFGRVVSGERGLEFTGTGLSVPRMHLDAVRTRLEEEQRRSGLGWPEYLKRNWPHIHAQQTEIHSSWMDADGFVNTDGEKVVASRAIYGVVDRGLLFDSLRGSTELQEDETGTVFVWLSAEEGGTGLATIKVAGEKVVLECNSRERLKRAKTMLAEVAGTAVKFEKDEFIPLEELKRQARENPRPSRPAKDEIPPAVKREVERQFMEDHYRKWLDMKLPALDGKTPRQAVRNAAGKRKVAELLKQLENAEAHKRKAGEYAYDVSTLRRKLGIKS